MRWAAKPEIDVRQWQRAFALMPRKIGAVWVWLEWYEWRGEPWGGIGADGIDYEYRLPI